MFNEINNALGYLSNHMTPFIIILIILSVILTILIYFIPTRIAFQRDTRNKWFILVLNILVAWTLAMWFVIFLWALLDEKDDADDHSQETKRAPY
jgi:membrane protein CcdC involved in cytochrome C biogenesis